MAAEITETHLAVLIDADNASATIIEKLLEEVALLGTANVKRIYGDWTQPNLGAWKEVLLKHSIQPVQSFAYTRGKNSTDSTMIIDAMDLLYAGNLQGFCIVSSDSDFTRLAARLRESGKTVYGFGEQKTPAAFIAACDKFTYTEIFRESREEAGKLPADKMPLTKELKQMIRSAVEAASDDDGWASLSAVGNYINKTKNDFDPRNYGYPKLKKLIEAMQLVEFQAEQNHVRIRLKKR